MTIPQKALAYCVSKIGCRYSQAERMKENVFDCSSLIFRAYKDAGYTFKTAQNTSTYLVYDTGFDLLYPASTKVLGQKLTSVEELVRNGYKPQSGDVIFIRTTSARDSTNKITHVVMVENSKYIIHARGTNYGVVRTSINLYGSKVVAVTRFRSSSSSSSSSPITTTTTTTTKSGVVRATVCTGNNVNIRETAGGKVLGSIDKDHPVIVSGTGEWVRVATVKDNKVLGGFIYSKYVK